MSSSLRMMLADLPKIDLHRHLEGSVRPRSVAEICLAHDIHLPTYDPDALASILQLSVPAADLEGFFQPFRTIKFCFVNKDEIARLAYEVVEDAWLDNVRYLELRFSPEFMAFYHKLSLVDVMDGITAGVELAKRRFPTVVRLIVSISRNLSAESMGMPWPSPGEIVELAIEYSDRRVVGIDLSGRENGFPPELFKEHFDIARHEGLGITVHAGEDAGPESVRSAIEHLNAARIGHGVRVVHDAEVLKMAVDRGVVLEICPTSNVLTHAVESLEDHPLRTLYTAGARVTINTDDPTVCGTTLTDEYELLVDKFGFSITDIERMITTAREAAFCGGI